ncbi:MAG: ABC transporter permease [Alistipes sp.]|nr:ABC transporter permease [Alistipes sp.]
MQEIFATVQRNKLRTFLTGFSVAWGIFMLIILLGSGNGLKNAMVYAFSDMSVNSVSIFNGQTSMPYQGFQSGRTIQLNEEDLYLLRQEFPQQIRDISASTSKGGAQIAYHQIFTSAQLQGATPEQAEIESVKMLSGRFLNANDLLQRRKVAVIDEYAANTLFQGEDPIGKMIQIDKLGYTVIGLYKGRDRSNSSSFYIPLHTLFLVYRGDKRDVDQIDFTVQGLETQEQMQQFEQALRRTLGAKHSFSPDDKSALWVRNRLEFYKQAMTVFSGIALFVWIIGIGTLTAGVVGVSNIMLVTVRERTFEFGIRKALGARPSSLVRLILVESVLITATFGYLGMIAGVGTMEIVNLFVERMAATAGPDDFQMFRNPTLNLDVTLSATLILILAGMIAGYIPARRAARIKTIDAMRHNK